jgi:hypothetical protein
MSTRLLWIPALTFLPMLSKADRILDSNKAADSRLIWIKKY